MVWIPRLRLRGRCAAFRQGGLALLVAALAVSSCGGSGGPTAPRVSEAEAEQLSFELVNAARRAAGVPELILDPAMSQIAREHSRKMRDFGFFGHVDPNGDDFPDRLRKAGFSFSITGENLARMPDGGDPASLAHGQFMSSSGHRENILNPRFRRMGVGVVRGGGQAWLTQDFLGP